MRHSYTPVFRDFCTSSMWAAPAATRVVWLWMLLNADPEGYVPGTIPGVAQQANVTLDEAIAAIELLEAPDPYSNSKELEGRRIVRVERGWHLTTFVSHRERAKHEADKATKRRWALKNYYTNRQPNLPGFEDLESAGTHLDVPKPKPKPAVAKATATKRAPRRKVAELAPVDAPVLPAVLHELPDDFAPDEALRMDAIVAGVRDLDARIASLRAIPIGGQNGVLASRLQDYIRSLFPKWRQWQETEAHKAAAEAASATQRGFRGGGGSGGAPEPQPPPASVPGFPGWVHPDHQAIATQHVLDLRRAAAAYERLAPVPPRTMRPIDVREPFARYLLNLAEERRSA